MRRSLALTALTFVPALSIAQAPSTATSANPEIVANGAGSVKLTPDRAMLTVVILTRANSAAEAGRMNAARIVPVIAALKRQRLPDSAIVTTSFTVNAERDLSGRVPVPVDAPQTYVARNSIQVTLARVELLGALIDTALAAGASEITNIGFGSSEATVGRQRAIAAAVRAARADAATAAEAAGGSLGDLIEISLGPDFGIAAARANGVVLPMSGVSFATPFTPNDLTLSVQARVRFSFRPRP